MTDTDRLADTVREALDEICPQAYAVDCDLPEHANAVRAHAALDELAALARALLARFRALEQKAAGGEAWA